MNAYDLKRMMDLPQPERLRTFERWLKHQGLTRKEIAVAIAHMRKQTQNDK